MIRRLSTKWVLTVLAAVLVPFLGYAWFLSWQMEQRESHVVRYFLVNLASSLAERLDVEIEGRREDIELVAKMPEPAWTLTSDGQDRSTFTRTVEVMIERLLEQDSAWDLVLLVDAKGQPVVWNHTLRGGRELPPGWTAAWNRDGFAQTDWFQEAMHGQTALVDQHMSSLVPRAVPGSVSHPENFQIGFAVPVRDLLDADKILGVFYGLENWNQIQNRVLKPPHRSSHTLAVRDVYESNYAWLWKADADTIIAHQDTSLYGKSVARDTKLPKLVAAARAADAGLFPDYVFNGVSKKAAFQHCAGPEHGGFGWVVGVGIDDKDTYAAVRQLREILVFATAFALALVIGLTILIARRTTAPIRALQLQTQRIAGGDLDTRIAVESEDELGQLARSFNSMSEQLGESRAKLIKAEKDAAWREMARQVAHEIKNPLTPISLSATLLKRARDEKSPEFDAIFDRTIEVVQRQVESMRKIASDFSAFAGSRTQRPDVVDVRELAQEVLALNSAWAQEQRVVCTLEGECGPVFVDRGELRRVLINLVSNAIEAMPRGGTLKVRLARRDDKLAPQASIEVEDSGTGISEELRNRLFEPYFTTRSHGTGLGLAISARLVDEMNGRIELLPVDPAKGMGTVARVWLPEHRA